MSKLRSRFVCAALLAIWVLVACAACSPSEPADTTPESESIAPEPEQSEESSAGAGAGSDLADWMTGEWAVQFVLQSVDPDAPWSRQAADQPFAQWTCEVDGGQMVIDADMHVYDGSFGTTEHDDWMFEGDSTWVDDDGVTWTSSIVVEGVRTGDDTFTAVQAGRIESDADGVLYTAVWDATGTRVP